MIFSVLVVFLVVQSAICSKPTERENPSIKKNCQDIKCPPIDQPVCAKVTSVNKNSKTLYILMVNLCEMEYMKCHQGLQATVVDMKKCGHEQYQTLNKLIKEKGRKRSKRDTDSDIIKLDQKPLQKKIARNSNITVLSPVGTGDFIVSPDNGGMPNLEPDENQNGFLDTSGSAEIKTAKSESEEKATNQQNTESEIHEPKNELPETNEVAGTDNDVAETEPEKSEPEHISENDHLPEKNDASPEKQEAESGHIILDSPPVAEGAAEDNSGDFSEALHKNIKFTDKLFFETKDKPHNNDYDLYQAECPTSCPSRDVMVCAKCQHDIYKTFMSVCHMRMFSCWFTDEQLKCSDSSVGNGTDCRDKYRRFETNHKMEHTPLTFLKLELVSRYPCAMSAPFLSTKPDTDPKGKIHLADDEDKILKFIYCREKGDPSYIEGKNKLLFSENSNVYPKCDLNTKRKLRD